MKLYMALLLPLIVILLVLQSCEDPETIIEHDYKYYVLCEGNFGGANSTVWGLSEDLETLDGPLHWDPNENALGDVGQSIYAYQDMLYIVVNNSHKIEVMDITEEQPVYHNTLDLAGSSPRYMAFHDNEAYVSCWDLNALIVINLTDLTITDTIPVGGKPEDMIWNDGLLYTSINLNPDWTSSDKVLSLIHSTEWSVKDTFTVVSGPGRMLINSGYLYVASNYYNAQWESFAGTSKIDLTSGAVGTKEYGQSSLFGSDLGVINDQIYRSYDDGVAALTSTLDLDTDSRITGLSEIYFFEVIGDRIFVGLSNYVAPDDLIVLDFEGNELAHHAVGALPNDIVIIN